MQILEHVGEQAASQHGVKCSGHTWQTTGKWQTSLISKAKQNKHVFFLKQVLEDS